MKETQPTQLFRHEVAIEENGQRIDALLAAKLSGYSRVFLRKVVQDGGGRVDRETVKPSFRLRTGQHVELDLPPPPDDGPQPEAIPLNILFEDEYLIAIDKPPAMVVHPAKGHWSGTLTSALAYHFQQLSDVGGPTRPGVVHRLDRDTSGVILIAKSNPVHLQLAAQFESRSIQKEYFAIVIGKVDFDRDIIRQPIGKHPYQRDKMAIRQDHPSTRDAETWYEVTERFDGFTALKLVPKTGRTHQIRVHLAHLRMPVLCDRLYGGHSQVTRGELMRKIARGLPVDATDQEAILDRQALHARHLELEHPITKQKLTLDSPLPADIQRVLEILRAAKLEQQRAERKPGRSTG